MGDKVTFAAQAEGCAVADPVLPGPNSAVSYVEPRVKFIKAWHPDDGPDPGDGRVECGDGTDYPMLITVAQLFELWYRVKDAKFDAGQAHSVDFGFATMDLSFTASAPDTDYFSAHTDDPGGADEHTVTVERSYTSGAPAANLTSERKIWAETLNTPTFTYLLSDWPAVNAFAHYAEMYCGDSNISVVPSRYTPYGTVDGDTATIFEALVELGFTGKVAVRNDAADGVFDPFNSTSTKLYLGLRFWSFAWDEPTPLIDCYADSFDDGTGAEIAGVTLQIVLSTGTISCPLYGRTAVTHSGPGYIIRATSWWPYKRLDGEAQWDGNTGEWLPEGTPFLNFNDPDNSMYHPAL